MELTLLLLLAVALAAAWGAMPRPDARRVHSERRTPTDPEGPVITVTDHREDDRGIGRWLLPALAGLATLAAAITAIVLGADL